MAINSITNSVAAGFYLYPSNNGLYREKKREQHKDRYRCRI